VNSLDARGRKLLTSLPTPHAMTAGSAGSVCSFDSGSPRQPLRVWAELISSHAAKQWLVELLIYSGYRSDPRRATPARCLPCSRRTYFSFSPVSFFPFASFLLYPQSNSWRPCWRTRSTIFPLTSRAKFAKDCARWKDCSRRYVYPSLSSRPQTGAGQCCHLELRSLSRKL
jgi:hypothetical protein